MLETPAQYSFRMSLTFEHTKILKEIQTYYILRLNQTNLANVSNIPISISQLFLGLFLCLASVDLLVLLIGLDLLELVL